MNTTIELLLRRWHQFLNLPRQTPPSWYRHRLYEELRERKAAKRFRSRLSETSDVFFSISRAKYDGFPVRRLPPFMASRHSLLYAYMLSNYTLRWTFYRTVARLCSTPHHRLVREVVNPGKDLKLEEVASRHHIDVEKFCRVGWQLWRVWPLLL
jgi:hypothetical protein